jgi:Mg2+/Co2+ transporter CorB
MLTKPYFIPASTPIYSQLHFFQENRERLGWWWTSTANSSAS